MPSSRADGNDLFHQDEHDLRIGKPHDRRPPNVHPLDPRHDHGAERSCDQREDPAAVAGRQVDAAEASLGEPTVR